MRTLVLSIAFAGVAAAMAVIAPADPGRSIEGAPAPLLKASFAQ